MSENITLYYAHDPMCSFCWAFRPTWTQVKIELAKTHPEIRIRYLLGGLAPDSNQPMSEAVQKMVRNAWLYIETHIPGTRFNHDFWTTQQPRRSTYPACRAVCAAKIINPELEDAMILAIQQAYYLNAQNPADNDTLIHCAESIGLDRTLFSDTLLSETCNQAFTEEMQFTRSIGINGFPGIVLVKGNSHFSVPIDYNRVDTQLNSLRQIVALL